MWTTQARCPHAHNPNNRHQRLQRGNLKQEIAGLSHQNRPHVYAQTSSNRPQIPPRRPKIEIKERHGQRLDLASIPARIRPALDAVEADRSKMKDWQIGRVTVSDIASWADDKLSEKWGKKAAAHVFHICKSGKDIEFETVRAGPRNRKASPISGPRARLSRTCGDQI